MPVMGNYMSKAANFGKYISSGIKSGFRSIGQFGKSVYNSAVSKYKNWQLNRKGGVQNQQLQQQQPMAQAAVGNQDHQNMGQRPLKQESHYREEPKNDDGINYHRNIEDNNTPGQSYSNMEGLPYKRRKKDYGEEPKNGYM